MKDVFVRISTKVRVLKSLSDVDPESVRPSIGSGMETGDLGI